MQKAGVAKRRILLALALALVTLLLCPVLALATDLSAQETKTVSGNYAVLEKNNDSIGGQQAYTLTFKYSPGQAQFPSNAVEVYAGEQFVNGFPESGQVWGGSVGSNITRVVFDNSVKGNLKPTSTAYWFEEMRNLKSISNASNLDTSQATNMCGMFRMCTSLPSLDIAGWKTGRATNMSQMFWGCYALTSLDISNWNVSKATDMSYMFNICDGLTTLNVSNWKPSSATNMTCMFNGCSALSSLYVANWDTSKVTDMSLMFNGCQALSYLDLSNWNTSRVSTMHLMFQNCYVLSKIKLGTRFSFKGEGITLTVMQAQLPETSQNGKDSYGWHRDGSSKLLTPAEFTETYNGSSMAGVWKREIVYTIKYSANGGSGSVASQTIIAGSSVKVASGSGLSRSGYTFNNWNDAAKGTGKTYTAGQQFTPTKNMTLYAQWKKNASSSSNGSNGSSSSSKSGGSGASGSDDPHHDEYDNGETKIVSTVAMYRLYNPNSGEHFYTSAQDEQENLVSLGWNDEGIGWMAPESSDIPVYRLYNAIGGEHHYTMDAAERDMLIEAGWNDEGTGWYSDEAQTVVLYREYNPNAYANNHNYTTDLSEHQNLISLGWNDEGTAWYGAWTGNISELIGEI